MRRPKGYEDSTSSVSALLVKWASMSARCTHSEGLSKDRQHLDRWQNGIARASNTRVLRDISVRVGGDPYELVTLKFR